MYRFHLFTTLLVMLTVLLSSCTSKEIPTQPPQPPAEYLSNALDWIETHSVKINTVDWVAIRREALALAPDPQTTADTYPAILFVMKQLGDSATFFLPPDDTKDIPDITGITAFYPEAVIVGIDPSSPAERAGLRVGDVIETINDAPPRQWQGTRFIDWYDTALLQLAVRRSGRDQTITVTLEKASSGQGIQPAGRRISTDQGNIGYIELPAGGGDWESYPTLVQQAIREIDRATTCGWIIDFRRNHGGDIWYYIAGMGPILGEGEVGGFVYLDGTRELWKYHDGKVFWNEQERDESLVEGTLYKLKHPMPPIALLISPATMAAGELAVVTFQGRGNVTTFGEPTGGSPFLVFHTGLSDGSFLGISGAVSMDRTGRIYDGPITPDEAVTIDWTLFGSDRDPVILVARDWLLNQADCAQK
jgi:C-terminal processing protease CtpA/Prc